MIGVPDSDVGAVGVGGRGAARGQGRDRGRAHRAVRDRIASYKKPRSVVFRTEPLPRLGWPIDYDALDAEYGGGGYPGSG